MKASDPPVIVEQIINKPVDSVWKAITEVDQMTKWFFGNIPDFKAEVGFETRFEINTGKRIFPHLWKIIEVINQEKIVYHWSYDGYDGEGLVTFELFEEGDGTVVKLTNIVTADFQDGIPEFSRNNCIGGWEYFIKGNLKNYIEAI